MSKSRDDSGSFDPRIYDRSSHTRYISRVELIRVVLTTIVLGLASGCFIYSQSRTIFSSAWLQHFAGRVWHAENSAAKYAICSSFGQTMVYTVNANDSVVECVTIENERISFVGPRDLLTSSIDIKTLPPNAVIIPGISDSHTHLLYYGSSRLISLEDGGSVQETVSIVRKYILANPEFANNKSKTVEGWGWNHMGWSLPQLPTAADLDSDPIIRGRPVILRSKDGHASWVSGATLVANGPYPESYPGGAIHRDYNGNPTGVFLDNAQELIQDPVWSYEDMSKRFVVTAQDLVKNGITSAHDALLVPLFADFSRGRLASEGKLPIRVRAARYFDPEDHVYWGNKTEILYNHAHDRLSIRGVKFVADGAMRSGGCAMKEPYSDNTPEDPYDRGFMRVSEEMINSMVPLFLRDGWQLVMHAIGDRANKIVVDAIERGLKEGNYDAIAARPRMEHLQIMSKDDIPRVGQLGIIASIQPSHVISDMWFAEPRIGYERAKGLYAFRDLLDGGARLALGTDLPVDSPSPFKTFYAAITRLGLDGTSPHGAGGFFPEQRISRSEVLRGMTIEPAYASFTEDILGSLEVGKRADFVILDQDIMRVSAAQVLETQILATVIDGVAVYGALP
ncbi:amidohydrolase family-domain-containing protein [Auriculariales sp. MPI-PUGE-AT-0066]|nr:amidohydrolase family-domain-containing protein [Auriculariales sp. MPI-PUGE-AT-0066]